MDHQPSSVLEIGVVARDYIRYFQRQTSDATGWNLQYRQVADLKLNTQGYATFSEIALDKEATRFEIFENPPGLSCDAITPSSTTSGANYFVWNPELADVHFVQIGPKRQSSITQREEQEQLEINGWEYIDGNWSRIIYAKSKLKVPPVTIPSDVAQNREVMHYLPQNARKLG